MTKQTLHEATDLWFQICQYEEFSRQKLFVWQHSPSCQRPYSNYLPTCFTIMYFPVQKHKNVFQSNIVVLNLPWQFIYYSINKIFFLNNTAYFKEFWNLLRNKTELPLNVCTDTKLLANTDKHLHWKWKCTAYFHLSKPKGVTCKPAH